jgi:hypothetical protein
MFSGFAAGKNRQLQSSDQLVRIEPICLEALEHSLDGFVMTKDNRVFAFVQGRVEKLYPAPELLIALKEINQVRPQADAILRDAKRDQLKAMFQAGAQPFFRSPGHGKGARIARELDHVPRSIQNRTAATAPGEVNIHRLALLRRKHSVNIVGNVQPDFVAL